MEVPGSNLGMPTREQVTQVTNKNDGLLVLRRILEPQRNPPSCSETLRSGYAQGKRHPRCSGLEPQRNTTLSVNRGVIPYSPQRIRKLTSTPFHFDNQIFMQSLILMSPASGYGHKIEWGYCALVIVLAPFLLKRILHMQISSNSA